jgi:large subunit ribosomal protein L24
MKKFHIKKGDQVKVISGNHKGKQGQVLEVIGDKDRALVESVNIVKRHTKPSAQFPEGGIIEKEGSIHISNLMKVDPKTGEPVRSAKAKTEVKKPAAKKTAAKKVTKTTKKVKEVSK